MKTLFLTIPLIAFLLLPTGCITTQSGKTIVDPAVSQSIAQDAAFVAAQALDSKYHGELVLTYKALNAFVAAGGGSVGDLQAALSNLPVSALQGDKGAVLNQNGALLLHQGGQLLLKLDKSEIGQNYVLPIATGLRDGLAQAGLGNS